MTEDSVTGSQTWHEDGNERKRQMHWPSSRLMACVHQRVQRVDKTIRGTGGNICKDTPRVHRELRHSARQQTAQLKDKQRATQTFLQRSTNSQQAHEKMLSSLDIGEMQIKTIIRHCFIFPEWLSFKKWKKRENDKYQLRIQRNQKTLSLCWSKCKMVPSLWKKV